MAGLTGICRCLLLLAGLAIFIACLCEARGGRGRSRYSGSGYGSSGGNIRINDRLSIHVVGVVVCAICGVIILVIGIGVLCVCCVTRADSAEPSNANTNAEDTADNSNTARYTAVPASAPAAEIDVPPTVTNQKESYDNVHNTEPPSYESVVNSNKGGNRGF